MAIGYAGIDHARAALALRERLAVADDSLDRLLDLLHADPAIDEAAVLSTCNRIEIYLSAPDVRSALDRAVEQLLAVTGVDAGDVAGLFEPCVDTDAARHLFAVAAGLRALAVGETQILTQVREAFEYAAARGASGPELGALARMAVICGKRVRAETTLGVADISVSAVAVATARQRLGALEGRTALLIGAGRINEVSAGLLREAGIGALVVVSRTREAAERLAARHGGRAGDMDALPSLLREADVAIAATRAPYPPVTARSIVPREAERPLLLFDIAVPRDVDPSVGALPGVALIDMDGLRAAAPRETLRDGVSEAWRLVDQCVERYVSEARVRRAVPLITRLRAHVDGQKEAELARTLAGLQHLPEADREAVALLAHRLVNRMFHHLASRMKLAATAPGADERLEALAFLFDEEGTEYGTVTAPSREMLEPAMSLDDAKA